MSSKNSGKKKEDLSTITTIKLLEETKQRLEKLREHKRESYDDILRKILYILNVVREDPEKSKKILERIDDLRHRMFEEEKRQAEDLEREMNKKDNKQKDVEEKIKLEKGIENFQEIRKIRRVRKIIRRRK